MKIYLVLLIFLIVFFSCKKNQEKIVPVQLGTSGVFIVNEGNFTWANSSLSYYDFNTQTVTQDIFAKANGIPLGDVAYSITVFKNTGYIVVNNSGLIYIVNLPDMTYKGVISGLVSPRRLLVVNDTLAYVSDLYNTRIAKLDLQANIVSGYINIGCSTENLLLKNGKVYVSSWSYNNKIFSFDAITCSNLDSVTLGKQPNSMVFDKNDNLWVLCDGCFEGSAYGVENASLWCINPLSLLVIKQFNFPDIQDSPIKLSINSFKDTLYYINNGVCKQSINENSVNSELIIPANGRNFYGLTVNPNTSQLFVADAKNYLSKGDLYIYSNQGDLLKTIEVGVNPGWLEIITSIP